mgnify:CR=1 FL=1
MRETEIIGQFFARDEAALTSVQSEYGAYCSTIARNILRDKEDVEECLNDTWLKAWNTIPPKRPQSLLAYLGRVTRNGALNMVRDQKRQKRAGDQYTTSLDEIGELSGAVQGQAELEGIESSALTEIINDFLGKMNAEDRDIFVRRYWFFDSVAAIAKRHAVSVGSVKMNLYRSRKKLLKVLKKEGKHL